MEFVIDRVSEDSFYENLLIGLPKVLERLPGVHDQYLERCPQVQHNIICAWEQKHGVILPEDLRSFYASSNGLLYSYKFLYNEQEQTDVNIVEGKILVNSLNNLTPVYGFESKPDRGINTEGDRYELKLGLDSKVFELVNLDDLGRVVLVYVNSRYLPTIWVHNASMQFSFLSDDFTTYLKMCIHHLGIPFWQFAYTVEGIPEWSEMLFRLLVPAILPFSKKIEDLRRSSEKKQAEEFLEIPVNKIDANIFRCIPKLQVPTVHNVAAVLEPNLSPRRTKNKKQLKPRFPIKYQKGPITRKNK